MHHTKRTYHKPLRKGLWWMLSLCMSMGVGVNANAETIEVYAAGSLRNVLQALKAEFRAPENTEIKFTFGPSGKLRERIEAAAPGQRPQLFFSASLDHPQVLVQNAHMGSSASWVRNSLCLVARPGVSLAGRDAAQLLLDERLKLGTSTPGADPAGDYTWQMFKKLDALKPGAYAALDARALKLTGAAVSTAPTQAQNQAPYAQLLSDGKADLFIAYCTNAAEAASQLQGITYQALPPELDVVATYGIAIAAEASTTALDFLRYVQGGRARNTLVKFGFGMPLQDCADVESALQPALAAWQRQAITLTASADIKTAPTLKPQQHALVTLMTDDKLSFARAAINATQDIKQDTAQSAQKMQGGALALGTLAPGHYEVFLNRKAWVDMSDAQGKALPSLRGPRWLSCAGVNKNIGFVVNTEGPHYLQLSQVEGDRIEALVMPLTKPAK